MSEEQFCKNCLFYKAYKLNTGEDADSGYCRRKPPVLVQGDQWAQFPAVGHEEWCGKWYAAFTQPKPTTVLSTVAKTSV